MNARGHLSSQTIDLLLLSALDKPHEEQATLHLGSCPDCQKKWQELNEDKARFEQFVFPRTVENVVDRAQAPRPFWSPRAWPALGAAAGVLAIAAMALVVISGQPDRADDYVGVKGSASLEVVARRAEGATFPVTSGAELKPKDRIRFKVNPAGARYLLIASRDGAGNFTVYHPFNGERSAALPQGPSEVPGSIELDGALGPERLVAVFSAEPVEAARVKEALQAQPGRPALGEAQVVTLEFVKAP